MKKRKRPARWCPRLPSRSAKGEWAEAAFLTKALGLRMLVTRPFCGHRRFDFLVISRQRVLRIQVKSTWAPQRGGAYAFHTASSGNRYRRGQIDFLVGYVVPEDAWYIIPVEKLRRRSAAVFPHNPRSCGQFERYREAWHLLR